MHRCCDVLPRRAQALHNLLIPVQVDKELVRWRHEYQDGPAGLARRTAATRLGAQTSGLEAAGYRRRAWGERWSREPVARPGAGRGGWRKDCVGIRPRPHAEADTRATGPVAGALGSWG